MELVATRSVEIGFCGTMVASHKCVYQDFASDPMVLITPNTEKYQAFAGKPFPIEQLKEETFISREKGSGTYQAGKELLNELGIDIAQLRTAVEIRSTESVKQMVSEGLGVGLIAQSAQDGGVHACQHRPGQDAAHGGAEHHDGQAVHQEADVHQTDDGQKAQTGEQGCKEHPAHIPAHQLEEAAYAGLAGGVLFDTLTGLEIVGRRKKTHSSCGTSLVFLTGTAGVLSGKCHCAGFTDINIPVFCQLCKIQPGLIVKKYLSLPFLRKMCYNDNGIFCNRRKPL